MADNTTAAGGASSGSRSNAASPELIVAIAALVISILAFFTATLQVLQQYFASATGYALCSERVMGKWWTFTRRRMRWSEFRFEVQFTVPVIFVARPTNTKGPMGKDDGIDEDKKIRYMDGSEGSIIETYTHSQVEYDRASDGRQNLRTVNNELVTWLDLLMAIQRMEMESRNWQQSSFSGGHYRPRPSGQPPPPSPPPFPLHILAVGLQRKVKSWDSMALALQKPYAITTIGHLIEIAAMLGIYWKEFDRGAQLYRAQGNGFSMRGSHVNGLGVVFTFRKTGPTWFQNHRVVPNDLVKELCFGFAPTIFRPDQDETHLYADEARDNKTLQLGTLAETAETLAVFGCSISTVGYFGKNGHTSRHSHIFPISFEMLAMIGRVFHIENSAFRMLPNPTAFTWDKKSLSLRRLLSLYASALRDPGQTNPEPTRSSKVLAVADKANRVEGQFSLDGLRPATVNQEADYSRETVAELRAALAICDAQLKNLPLVERVFRVHLEVVLGILNGADDGHGHGMEAAHAPTPASTLADLDSAPLDERYMMLINLYVGPVRIRVVETVYRQLRATGHTISVTTEDTISPADKATINDTWCILVFRMLFWLLLHDFHGKDVQLPKSELFGSRLAVYIA